jgi:hypothetical protein
MSTAGAGQKRSVVKTTEALRTELNRLQRAVVRETNQARCDIMEQRIRELEQELARHGRS